MARRSDGTLRIMTASELDAAALRPRKRSAHALLNAFSRASRSFPPRSGTSSGPLRPSGATRRWTRSRGKSETTIPFSRRTGSAEGMRLAWPALAEELNEVAAFYQDQPRGPSTTWPPTPRRVTPEQFLIEPLAERATE
jgi:hypothetical protein